MIPLRRPKCLGSSTETGHDLSLPAQIDPAVATIRVRQFGIGRCRSLADRGASGTKSDLHELHLGVIAGRIGSPDGGVAKAGTGRCDAAGVTPRSVFGERGSFIDRSTSIPN
jgi:hypothetical protein